MALNDWSESDQKAIREQLDRILKSGPFHQSRRRQRFLKYIVNETLAGRGERLKGYNLALEVFDRPESFDPVTDPLVRIPFASIYRRAHTHRKSNFGTRALREFLVRRGLRRMKFPQLFPPSPCFLSM